jgi:beta-glucosidase-like glycosyl hydrolase
MYAALFIAIDQEGGYVTRLREGVEMPGNMALGATGDPHFAKQAGHVHGSELAALGFNFNFAPVVDVNSNQNNPVIGVRSYSDDLAIIDEMSAAYIAGIHQYGLLTAAKQIAININNRREIKIKPKRRKLATMHLPCLFGKMRVARCPKCHITWHFSALT